MQHGATLSGSINISKQEKGIYWQPAKKKDKGKGYFGEMPTQVAGAITGNLLREADIRLCIGSCRSISCDYWKHLRPLADRFRASGSREHENRRVGALSELELLVPAATCGLRHEEREDSNRSFSGIVITAYIAFKEHEVNGPNKKGIEKSRLNAEFLKKRTPL